MSGRVALVVLLGPILAVVALAPVFGWAIHWLTPAAFAFGSFYCQLFPAGAC